jgi:hypothetical protein
MLKVLVSLFAVASVASGEFLGMNPHGIPIFKVQLNDPPAKRFDETSLYFKGAVRKTIDAYLSLIPEVIFDIVDTIGGTIRWIQPEYYEEIDGMAAALDLNTNALMFMQYVNEFSAFCTSSIVKQPDGTIIHDRNMDFAFPPLMRAILYEGRFYQGDEYKFEAVMFAGTNGVFTGMKSGAFSISLNNRKPSFRTDIFELLKNVASIFTGSQQISKLIRDTLAECGDYDCAYNRLSTQSISCPGYLAIAGTKGNEGAIITRNRDAVDHLDQLSDTNWFLSQTNDDHWTGVCTARCQASRSRIAKIGQQNINAHNLRHQVLEQYPNLNEHGIYNTIMIPGKRVFDVETIESDQPDPDVNFLRPRSYSQPMEWDL